MNALQALQQAVLLHQQGKLDQAERGYTAVLKAQPNHFDANHLLGIIRLQQGRNSEALDYIGAALKLKPNSAVAFSNLGLALGSLGRTVDALASFDKALAIKPDYAEALTNRGNVLLTLGRPKDALASYDRALAINPGSAEALYNRGNVLVSLNRPEDALASYDKALAIMPNSAEAITNRGNVLLKLKRPVDALASFDKVVAIRPGSAEAHYNRGNTLLDLGRPEDALASFDKALAIKPDYAEALNNRCNALLELKRATDALASVDKALAIRPDYAEALNNRGHVLLDLQRSFDALASFDMALAVRPDYAEALTNRGIALLDLKRSADALASHDKALKIRPDHAEALINHGAVLLHLKRPEEALASLDKALEVRPDHADALTNRGLVLMDLKRLDEALASLERVLVLNPKHFNAWAYYGTSARRICNWRVAEHAEAELITACRLGSFKGSGFYILGISDDLAVQQAAAENYVRAHTSPTSPLFRPRGAIGDSGKLRIGYLSADFRQHPVATLIVELIELHDRSRFEVFGFSAGGDDKSAVRQRIKDAFDVFVDAQDMSDVELRTAIQEAQIDIIVDLGGQTADGRILALAQRAAPIQATYLGYPGTVGAQFIDYAIVDKFVVPDSAAEFFTEKLAYLPHCYLVSDRKRPTAERMPSRAECGLPPHGFVFCCFNGSYKIAPAVFDHWMRILMAVPESVLWLLADNRWAQGNLRQEAQKRGVDPARLVFMPRGTYAEHLAALRLADLFLDTWHYNAHTTASDALWVGLPVLTYAGRSFAARVAGSLLHAIGLPELVTYTPDDYEALAIKLAREPSVLEELQKRLAANINTAPLFQTDLFARHIEAAFKRMWEQHRRGEKAETFAVATLQ